MLQTRPTAELIAPLRDARARTLAAVADLRDAQLVVPLLETINPFLWEIGHIAYFAEFWTLRHCAGRAQLIRNADALYDSAKIAHDTRWSLPLPSRDGTLEFMTRELDGLCDLLESPGSCERDLNYFARLALYHEDMHAEALVYTRGTLAYPRPNFAGAREAPPAGPLPGDVRIPGRTYRTGALASDGFVFDNEKWVHDVDVKTFEIARAPVTNQEFAAFVEDGGYGARLDAEHPQRWRRENGSWQRRHFDRWIPLRPHEPVVHVSAFEAQAYCDWAGRRLPTEAEWEVAATGGERRRYPWGEDEPTPQHANLSAWYGDVVDVASFELGESPTGCRQMLGNVWEWTATPFAPYPGFAPDPYKEYSQPWFNTHTVLRGGAWSTRERLVTTRWRNFYRPGRVDIITGFRTCKP